MKLLLKHKLWISRGESLANSLKKLIFLFQNQTQVIKEPGLKANEKTPNQYKTLHGSRS